MKKNYRVALSITLVNNKRNDKVQFYSRALAQIQFQFL